MRLLYCCMLLCPIITYWSDMYFTYISKDDLRDFANISGVILFGYLSLSFASGCFAEISAWTNNLLGEPCLSTKKFRERTSNEQVCQLHFCNPLYFDPRDLSNNSCATTFREYGEIARAKDEFDNNRLRSVAPYTHAMER